MTSLSAEAVESRVQMILARLGPLYPDAHTALDWSNPIELMVAVILSAQCTDLMVNRVTKELFRKYHDAADYAAANPQELEESIRSTGFFRNKTKHIIGACAAISAEHGGKIPASMKAMTALPGIGRKSANIILAEVYGMLTGIPVDTHVERLTVRLGLTDRKGPGKIEAAMMPRIPQKDWYRFSSQLVFHGRAICNARKPACPNCVLNDFCPAAFAA